VTDKPVIWPWSGLVPPDGIDALRAEVEGLKAVAKAAAETQARTYAEISGLLKWNSSLLVDVERLRASLKMALDIAENGLIDFGKYGLTCDDDIAKAYRNALSPPVVRDV